MVPNQGPNQRTIGSTLEFEGTYMKPKPSSSGTFIDMWMLQLQIGGGRPFKSLEASRPATAQCGRNPEPQPTSSFNK